MRRYYSKQLGAFIIDETDDCSLQAGDPQMSGILPRAHMGNVEFFPKAYGMGCYDKYQQTPQMAGMGNVKYFPGAMGSPAPQMGAFDLNSALSDAVKKVLPGATQSVVNDFLKSDQGKTLATKVENTAYAVGSEAAKAQAASQLAEMQQTLEAKYRSTIDALQKNWKTIAMIGGGVLAAGLLFYMLKGRSSAPRAAMANPRRRRR